MDQTEITAAIRRAIGEITARTLPDSVFTSYTLRAVTQIGLRIKEKDPSYFNKRKSITSYTNVFAFPTGCKKVNQVWDYDGDAVAITGAADNGSGLIRITAASHGIADGTICTIHDVAGTTEANGTCKITYVDADNFDIQGSTFANAYTSGGYVFEEKQNMEKFEKISLMEQSNAREYGWYPRETNIVIDDINFTNSIIVDYEAAPSTIAEIPSEYHEYLVSWPVVQLIILPKWDDPTYQEKLNMQNLHMQIINTVEDDIQRTFKSTSQADRVVNVWDT